MTKTQPDDWLAIGMEAWFLTAEAAAVVILRSAALAMGGPPAYREAQLMIAEKAEANAELGMALASGKLGSSAESVTRGAVAHYRKRVRANRRRLSRG